MIDMSQVTLLSSESTVSGMHLIDSLRVADCCTACLEVQEKEGASERNDARRERERLRGNGVRSEVFQAST